MCSPRCRARTVSRRRSVDDTPEMIKSWTKDPRFKYTRVPKNIGNMACRNMALEMASGTWITNIDSDDFWTLDRLEKFAAFFKARPKAGFVFSDGWLHRYDRLIGSSVIRWQPVQQRVFILA